MFVQAAEPFLLHCETEPGFQSSSNGKFFVHQLRWLQGLPEQQCLFSVSHLGPVHTYNYVYVVVNFLSQVIFIFSIVFGYGNIC